MGNTIKYAGILGLICVVMGGAIGLSYSTMKDRIARKELEVTLMALDQVLPAEAQKPIRVINGLEPGDRDAVYAAVNDRGETIGYAAIGGQQGYSSRVEVMVGVRPNVSDLDAVEVIAIAVVSQQETPGLGTRIEERKSSKTIWDVVSLSDKEKTFTSPFLDQFQGKTYNTLEVVKIADGEHVQAVTAATISSTAAVEAVRKAVVRIHETVRGTKTHAHTGATSRSTRH